MRLIDKQRSKGKLNMTEHVRKSERGTESERVSKSESLCHWEKKRECQRGKRDEERENVTREKK